MHIYSRRIKSGCSDNNKQKLAVFDFKVNDDNEGDVRKKSKVENNPRNVNAVVCDKYTFLETIAVGKSITAEEINYESSLDIDAINVSHIAPNLLEDPSGMMVDSNDALTAADNPSESVPELRPDVPESEVSAPAEAEVNVAATSASPCNDQSNSPMLDLLPSLTESVCSDKAPESEVSAPSGAEVNVADQSNSPMLDSLPSLTEPVSSDKAPESEVSALSGAEVNVATTSALPCNEQLNSGILDSLLSVTETVCSDEALETDQHKNGSICERSPAFSDFAEDDGAEPLSDHCIDGWEMESQDSEDMTTVVLYPDYVMYRDGYYTNYMISFTESFIEMEGSTRDGDDQTFKCKWGIEDVLHIRCHLFKGVEMAKVKIHVLNNNTIDTENVECTSGTELKFAVSDPSWYGIVDKILSLNAEYKALWSSVLESEDNVLRHTGVSFSKYLPAFDKPFEEVVYPKGDADAVSISNRDFDLLQPDTFLNDTIIDFYIKYLKNKIDPDERHRYHFFNSFFFRKLADPDKDPLDASRGREGFQRVKKWTRKVKLFEKDFVFIPVNYNYHWSLIVICHLGEVATYEDKDANDLSKVPCVLHMDSIRGSHAGLKDLVQSYLKEEWIGRQQMESEDISSRFDNLRFIYLELPQQLNSYDCGLFLLHYVELFLEQAPMDFNPFKTTNNSNFLNVDWFPPAEASLKRIVIQKLIRDLLENPYQESSSTVNDRQWHLSCPTTDVHKGTVVNLSQQDCNSSLLHQISQDDKEIELSLIPSSSSIQCADDPRIDMTSSFRSESFVGTPFPNFNHTNSFNEYKCSLIPIAEDVDAGEQFVYSQTESGVQQENDDSTLPYSSEDFQTQELWHAPVISDHQTVNNNIILSQEASISCEDSVEIGNDISQLDSEHISKKRREPGSPVYDTFAGYLQMGHGNGNVDPTSSMDMLPGSSFRFPDTGLVGSENFLGLESDIHHPTKKIRMTEP